MTTKISSAEQFKEAQLSWIATLSQPALHDVLNEIAKPENAGMRAGTDLSELAQSKGLKLPPKTKLSAVIGPDQQPMGTICWSWDPADLANHPYHCITVRNPIVLG